MPRKPFKVVLMTEPPRVVRGKKPKPRRDNIGAAPYASRTDIKNIAKAKAKGNEAVISIHIPDGEVVWDIVDGWREDILRNYMES